MDGYSSKAQARSRLKRFASSLVGATALFWVAGSGYLPTSAAVQVQEGLQSTSAGIKAAPPLPGVESEPPLSLEVREAEPNSSVSGGEDGVSADTVDAVVQDEPTVSSTDGWRWELDASSAIDLGIGEGDSFSEDSGQDDDSPATVQEEVDGQFGHAEVQFGQPFKLELPVQNASPLSLDSIENSASTGELPTAEAEKSEPDDAGRLDLDGDGAAGDAGANRNETVQPPSDSSSEDSSGAAGAGGAVAEPEPVSGYSQGDAIGWMPPGSAVPAAVSAAANGLEVPSGYVELSGGVYVPESFVKADAAFRQAREARYQAWAVYQQAMYQRSAMVAALLPSELWQPETGYPYADSAAFRNVAYHATGNTGMLNGLPLNAQDAFPLYPLGNVVEMTSVYGWRVHPISGLRSFHDGIDLAAPTGTPVLASLSGVVESAGSLGGYGYAVVIRHLNGRLQTLYGHLSAIYVEPGEVIKQGQIIGLVGSTGNSTGPHLHYEMLQYGNAGWATIDPTSLVTFAGQLLQQRLYSGYYAQVQTTSAVAPAGANPYAASFFNPSLYGGGVQQRTQQGRAAAGTAAGQQQARGVEIRVGVEIDVESFTVGGSVPIIISDSNGNQIGTLNAGQAHTVTRSGAGVTIGAQGGSYAGAVFLQASGGGGLIAINGRYYRGRVLVAARPQGGVSAINWVNIEQYLWGVVGHEAYPSWNVNALKAQAVAARSYAMYYRYNPVSRDWYDIGDDTYYQAYGGTTKEFDTTTAAVNATAGQVLMQGGAVLQAMYAATEELSREAHGGIGMAQWGAADKAAAGWGYTSILAHYYPGASLGAVR